MALAFDNSKSQYNGSGATSHTIAYTTSGSDRAVACSTRSYDANAVTGVTYNAVSLTQTGGTTTLGSDAVKYWYLINPATGSNNFVISLSSSRRLEFNAVSFTGAKQSAQPDAQAQTSGTSTTATNSVTTVADNSIIACFTHGNGTSGSVTGGTNATLGSQVTDRCGNGYSGLITPAGSTTQVLNWGGSGQWSFGQVSFSPVPASGPANLKSYNGNAVANIKSMFGNVIANVKSFDGNS
jgi:hypothetical protein